MKTLFITIVLLLAFKGLISQDAPSTFKNPILPGYHPDPSICMVGNDYYMVNSTLEWFPGIPVFHSKDMVNWKLIGHSITRPNQVELPEGLGDSRGIYAVTIHYHNGLLCWAGLPELYDYRRIILTMDN